MPPAAVALLCVALALQSAGGAARCRLRRYTHRAQQTDMTPPPPRSMPPAAVALLCVALALQSAGGAARCRLRRYTHRAQQTDMTGRRCWDDVRVRSCGGYCLSYEISDWQFPYKESHHPVCVHGERRHASVRLAHCDPHAEPGTELYHYVEARSCKCQMCSSEDTSCEWMPPDATLLGGLMLKEEEEELE